ncbi:MAG: enolase C-terminal domain-like protein [Pseudomonadota bacterium]
MTSDATAQISRPALLADLPLGQRLITGFDVWHVALPVVSRRDHGIGAVADQIEIVILRLESSCGAVGWGEAAPWSVFTGSPEASFAALDRYIRPHIEGQSLDTVGTLCARAQASIAHATEAKAALESALLDLVGQISGLRVADLLGGVVRDRIPLSVSLANPDFAQDLALTERLLDDGITIVKLKAGFAEHSFDLQRLEALRTRFPQLDIRVDFNQGLPPADAPARVADVAAFVPTFVEQPVRADLFELMARIRAQSNVPILADESVFSPADMTRAMAGGICDGVSIKVMKTGSLRHGQTIAAMAEAAGLSGYGGDMFETGLGHTAGVHMIAASPNITLGCEFYQARYYLTQDLLTDPFAIDNGDVILPQGPGLGVTVNQELIAHYAKAHSAKTPTP